MSDEQPSIRSAVSARDSAINTFILRLFKTCGYDAHTLLEEINNTNQSAWGWFNISIKNMGKDFDDDTRRRIFEHAQRVFAKNTDDVRYNEGIIQIKYEHHEELKIVLQDMIKLANNKPLFGTALQKKGSYARSNSSDTLVKLIFALSDATGVEPAKLIDDVFIERAEVVELNDKRLTIIPIKSPYKVALVIALDAYAKEYDRKPLEQPNGNYIVLDGVTAAAIKNMLSPIHAEILGTYERSPRPLDHLKSLLENSTIFLGTVANVNAKIKRTENVKKITVKDDEGKDREVEIELPPEYQMQPHQSLSRLYSDMKKWMDKLLHHIEDVQRRPYNTGPVTRLLESLEMALLKENLKQESKEMQKKYEGAPEYAKGEVVRPEARRWVREVLEAIEPKNIEKDVADYQLQHPLQSTVVRGA